MKLSPNVASARPYAATRPSRSLTTSDMYAKVRVNVDEHTPDKARRTTNASMRWMDGKRCDDRWWSKKPADASTSGGGYHPPPPPPTLHRHSRRRRCDALASAVASPVAVVAVVVVVVVPRPPKRERAHGRQRPGHRHEQARPPPPNVAQPAECRARQKGQPAPDAFGESHDDVRPRTVPTQQQRGQDRAGQCETEEFEEDYG